MLVVASVALVLSAGAAAAQDVSVSADAQATEGDSVLIDTVEIDEDGWVAVYEESVLEEPDFDSLVGVEAVDEGTHTNIDVETEIEEHGFYYAVLHYDESAATEFDYPDDPVVTDDDGNDVQDFFFVSVETEELAAGAEQFEDVDIRSFLLNYAETNQQKREIEHRLSNLRDSVDELEDREDEDVEDELQNLRDEIDAEEEFLEELEVTLADREELLRQIEEMGAEEVDDDDDADDDADEETDDDEEDDDTEPEGLPGFTAVAALVALLTGGALLRRNE